MTKRLLALLLLLGCLQGCAECAFAQNTQPQNSFSSQVLAFNPAVYLTFNNPAQLFRENTTGVSFLPWDGQVGFIPAVTVQTAVGSVLLVRQPFASAGTLTSLSLQDYSACGAGARTIVIASGSGTSYTIVNSFTVTAASTTALQTFTVGTGLPAGITYAAGNLIGMWAPTGGCVTGRDGTTTGPGVYTFAAASALPGGAQTYSAQTPDIALKVTGAPASETILSGQTGFDNKEPNNTAAALPYNTFLYAPGFTLGDFEWSQPVSFMYQIDRLNWGRSGTKVLLSKGNTASNSAPWWKFYVWMKTSTVAQFCLQVNGAGGPGQANYLLCTPNAMDFPNGYNYNVFLTNTGTGAANGFGLQINGTIFSLATTSNGGSYGLGSVTATVGGSGTGYAAATPFHSVGGGTNCTVEGTLNASGGVPSAATLTQALNYGCTGVPTLAAGPYMAAIAGSGSGYAASTAFTSTGGGAGCSMTGTMTSSGGVPASVVTNPSASLQLCTSAPTLVFTSPTGTGETITAVTPPGSGATLTAALSGNTISTATTAPLYLNGSWQAAPGAAWTPGASVAGSTNAAEQPLLVDEFAAFSGAPNQSLIQGAFYQTKFYQGLLKTIPANPYVLVFDNDGCADPDNLYALAATIAAQKMGYIRLAGVVDSSGDGISESMYRNMLDQAGLAHIPMTVPSAFGSSSTVCTAANSTAFNATTPQTTGGYSQAAAMYRTILAANPATPVYIMLAGSFRGVSDLMQSGADGISSLSGAQLLAQNAANGGAIYAQGLGANLAFTTDNTLEDWTAGQYVVSHNASLPIFWYGGQPQSTGPGVLSTRNAKDPMYLFAATYGADTRQAFDSLPTASFLSSAFAGGVTVAIGGSGTGYAASTAFTSTGGGPNCTVSGYMLSTGGVPSSIQYLNGGTYPGLGNGCTTVGSLPTIVLTAPTGTGVTLTAALTEACGTVTITAANSGSTSTGTCSSHYFLPYSVYADPSNAPLLTWFLNALIDPPPNGAPRVQ